MSTYSYIVCIYILISLFSLITKNLYTFLIQILISVLLSHVLYVCLSLLSWIPMDNVCLLNWELNQ